MRGEVHKKWMLWCIKVGPSCAPGIQLCSILAMSSPQTLSPTASEPEAPKTHKLRSSETGTEAVYYRGLHNYLYYFGGFFL